MVSINQCYTIPLKHSNYNPSLNAVGIDLGTTECCAAVIRRNGPDFVVLDPVTSLRTMPSYVAFDEDEPKCGQIVVNRMRTNAKYSIFDIKRIIGRCSDEVTTDSLWPFKVLPGRNKVWIEIETVKGTDVKSPEEVTAALLNHIKVTNEAYQNTSIDEVVISIPSAFSQSQKDATKVAAEYAGIKTVHFIPEPIAAAFAYFTEIEIKNFSNILICDCGGGTVDICVAKVVNDRLTVLSSYGDSLLGGRDFDRMLFNHFDAILKHKYGIYVTKTNKRYVLKQKCQEIKHNLSAAYDDILDVSDFDASIDATIKITREEFETMTTDLIHRIKNVILQAILNAEKQEINYVFQVGGGCRMPVIKNLLSNMFPKAFHQCNLYPDWVVAHGAALYAYYIKMKQNRITVVSERIMKTNDTEDKSLQVKDGQHPSNDVVKNVRSYKEFLDAWTQREIKEGTEDEPLPRPRYTISARHVYPDSLKTSQKSEHSSSINSAQQHNASLRPSDCLNEHSRPGKVDQAISYNNYEGDIHANDKKNEQQKKRYSTFVPLNEDDEAEIYHHHHYHNDSGKGIILKSRKATLKQKDIEEHKHQNNHRHESDEEYDVDIHHLRSVFESDNQRIKSRRASVLSSASGKSFASIPIVPASRRQPYIDNP